MWTRRAGQVLCADMRNRERIGALLQPVPEPTFEISNLVRVNELVQIYSERLRGLGLLGARTVRVDIQILPMYVAASATTSSRPTIHLADHARLLEPLSAQMHRTLLHELLHIDQGRRSKNSTALQEATADFLGVALAHRLNRPWDINDLEWPFGYSHALALPVMHHIMWERFGETRPFLQWLVSLHLDAVREQRIIESALQSELTSQTRAGLARHYLNHVRAGHVQGAHGNCTHGLMVPLMWTYNRHWRRYGIEQDAALTRLRGSYPIRPVSGDQPALVNSALDACRGLWP